MRLMPAGNDSEPDKNVKVRLPRAEDIEDITTGLIKDGNDQLSSQNGSLYLTIDSDKSLVKVCVDLDRAFIRHEFDVLAVHDIKDELNQKGIEFAGNCIAYEVINYKLAKNILDGNPQMAALFPCKIIVHETAQGKRRLSALRLTKLIELNGSTHLKTIANNVEEVIEKIMKDAAGFSK